MLKTLFKSYSIIIHEIKWRFDRFGHILSLNLPLLFSGAFKQYGGDMGMYLC